MSDIVDVIREQLRANADEATKEGGQRFFKEAVKLYGVKTAAVSRIGKEVFKTIPVKKKSVIFGLCEELWCSGYLEESFIACNWSYAVCKDYEPEDFEIFEAWINNYVKNWASCDTFCNHTVGAFVDKYPEYLVKLREWAKSSNLWMRRAAAVSLIIPAKEGRFLKEIFEIADILLLDREDLVQKGYGWMLKAASQAHQVQVFEYVVAHKGEMPRTALRYAIEKMPKELKVKAMEK